MTLLFVTGCRQIVEDDFQPIAPIPVVSCIMHGGQVITLQLSLTSNIGTSDIEFINDAQVLLYADATHLEQMTNIGGGTYTSAILAEPSKMYRYEIEVPGYEVISGSQSLPPPDSIYNIQGNPFGYKDEEGTTHPSISFTFNNDLSVIHYYQVILHKQTSERDIIIDHVQNTDPVLLAEGIPLTIFSTENIKTENYTMTINYRGGYIGPLIIEFRSVSFDYYQFVKQRYLYESGRYPDIVGGVVTAFPVHSNIVNGYGIFAGYSSIMIDTGIEF